MTEPFYTLDEFVGDSAWTERLRQRVRQIAQFHYGVLVTGPSGTGKELVARAIHGHSPRVGKPFIPVNCAAVPASLFSSQLFGHVKGAFTGADYASLGCFRAADGGTLFLDEIGDLDLDCQAKLLRVLQERSVCPVGGHEATPVDVRTVAATNRDLAAEVRAGRFRLDLYYRLNVLAVETLGLAARPDDIPALASFFLAKTALECGLPKKRLHRAALQLLQDYPWPGNVRELENFIERAVVMTHDDVIGPEAFPEILTARLAPDARGSRPLPGGFTPPKSVLPPWPSATDSADRLAPPPPGPSEPIGREQAPTPWEYDQWPSLAAWERQHIQRTLRETFYNQSAAARLLNVDRKLLARKIRKYKIKLPGNPPADGPATA